MANLENTSNMSLVFIENLDPIAQLQDPFFSDEARRILETIFYSAFGGLIGVLGSGANVINIIVFAQQGFNDSVSISLCALAISDLGVLLPMAWISVFLNPEFQNSEISFNAGHIHYITGGLPHSCFVRITSWITAFITFERCVCVALPLKVKNIITHRRTLISVVAISLVILSAHVPIYTSFYLAPSFQVKLNKTKIGLQHTSNTKYFENILFSVSAVVQISSFIIVIICTVIMLLQLLIKSQRRHIASSVSRASDSISIREKRVMKMIAVISSIFIVCYFPSVVNLILMVHFSPEYSAEGKYVNTCFVSWAIVNTIDGINSSVTLLVYYNMSSKFRATFKGFFSTECFAVNKTITLKIPSRNLGPFYFKV